MTVEEALQHIGGAENFVTEEGRALIHGAARDYIWQYPDKSAFCTACGAEVTPPDGRGFRKKHGAWIDCPLCGKRVMFRHEARGHFTLYDQFVAYEWRKSEADREAVILTASHVSRNSGWPWERPEESPLCVTPRRFYILRPGKAVAGFRHERRDGWRPTRAIGQEHHCWGMGSIPYVHDPGQLIRALSGTRIGAVYAAATNARNGIREDFPLFAVANCARRPYLEYLCKCGQGTLAGELMEHPSVPRSIVPRPRAKKPAPLLGLSEGQWYEVRRDRVTLTVDLLEKLNALRRMGLKLRVSEADALDAHPYTLGRIAPSAQTPGRDARDWQLTIGDLLKRADVPEKLQRKAYRRILAEANRYHEWYDYLIALRDLGENLSDPALLLPRDLPAMHDRMTGRLRTLREEARTKGLEHAHPGFGKRLSKWKREYSFDAAGLTLRPYESAAEIVAEGKALSICIGSYAESYLSGKKILCCLRRAEEPDVPWRAVEFSTVTGRVVQDRGYKNDWAFSPGDTPGIEPGTRKQLRAFWAAWERSRP